jgi:hypothetical protein
VLEQNAPRAKLANRLSVVTDEENGSAVSRYIFHLSQTFFLERGVADSENFVDEENLRLEVRRNGKRQACVHAAAVSLRRSVDELLDLRKVHYLVESPRNLAPAHSENRAAEKNVLTACELRMKSGSNFEQRPDSAIDLGASVSRLRNARENLEQRALPRAISPDDSNDFAFANIEAHIAQRPECLERFSAAECPLPQCPRKRDDLFLKCAIRLPLERTRDAVRLREPLDANCGFAHTESAKRSLDATEEKRSAGKHYHGEDDGDDYHARSYRARSKHRPPASLEKCDGGIQSI